MSNIPVHVAIIPDGNRRWAKEKGLPALEGHRRGADNFEKLLYAARDLGVKYITGWFFSTENWRRTEEENKYLFDLARNIAQRFRNKFIKEKIRFVHLGRKDRIPPDVAEILSKLEEDTKDFTDLTVCVAMDYGGHDELLRTIKKIQDGGLEINEQTIEEHLDTRGIPAPDLIIRTSGEQRLSGFMSWQSAYAEFYFPKCYFPDFGPEKFKKAIKDFSNRERRFGGDSKKC